MKSIKLFLAITVMAFVFYSCGEKGLGIIIGNGYEMVNGYPYYYPYSNFQPQPGTTTNIVGYVKSGVGGNQNAIPILYRDGSPVYDAIFGQYVIASGAYVSGPQGQNFFVWLNNQPTGSLYAVIVQVYNSGITLGRTYKIIGLL